MITTSRAGNSCGERTVSRPGPRPPGPVAGKAITSCRGGTTGHGDGFKVRLHHSLSRPGRQAGSGSYCAAGGL